MPEIQCANPKCQRMNPPNREFCSVCGTKLPQPAKQMVPVTDAGMAELEAAHQQLQQSHAAITSDYQQLSQAHQQVVEKLGAAQQQTESLQTQNEAAQAKIDDLLTQLNQLTSQVGAHETNGSQLNGEIEDLRQKLLQAEAQLSAAAGKVQAFEKSDVGQAVQPLWTKLLVWISLPVLGATGGGLVGIHSPMNPYRNTQPASAVAAQQQLQAAQAQLATVKQTLEKAQQDLSSQQQANAQLSNQLESASKDQKSSSSELASTQLRLKETKAALAKEQAAETETQQQLQEERSRSQQLSVKAAVVSGLQAILEKHPYLTYKGPTQGTITVKYNGRNDKPAKIALEHLQASGDSNLTIESTSGTPFPTVPLIVEPMSKNVSVLSPPSPSSNWQKITILVQGKGSNQAVLRWTVF